MWWGLRTAFVSIWLADGRKRRLTAASLGQFLYGILVGVEVAGMEPMLLVRVDESRYGLGYEVVEQGM
jgi:hypothetical protein